MDPLSSLIIGAHLATVHLGEIEGNKALFTPGIYAVHAESGLTGGFYRNSLSRTRAHLGDAWTVYVGKTVPLSTSVSGTLAVATGYGKPTILVGISWAFGPSSAARVSWVPHKTSPLSLSVERSFK